MRMLACACIRMFFWQCVSKHKSKGLKVSAPRMLMTLYIDNLNRAVKQANDNLLYEQVEKQNCVNRVQSQIIDELLDQVANGKLTGNTVTCNMRIHSKEPLAKYSYLDAKWTIAEMVNIDALNEYIEGIKPDPAIRIAALTIVQTSVKDNHNQCSCCFWCPCFFFPLCMYDVCHGRKYRIVATIGIAP